MDRPELREKAARICNHTHTRDGYSVDWEELNEYEQAVFLNDADQIIALFPDEEVLLLRIAEMVSPDEAREAIEEAKRELIIEIDKKMIDCFEGNKLLLAGDWETIKEK